MSDEPNFFDGKGTVIAFARRDDLDTSREAAASVTPRIRQLQIAVLEYALDCWPGGFTDPAMNAHFGVTSSTYRTRRAELVDMGMIHDTGERVTLGAGGRKHAVWRITDRGMVTLQAAQNKAA